jgi:hypothetical protein
MTGAGGETVSSRYVTTAGDPVLPAGSVAQTVSV